jgi:hypothetical protein
MEFCSYAESKTRASSEFPAVPYRPDQQKSRNPPNMEDVIEFCHKASKRLMSEAPQSTFPEVPNNGMIGIILGKASHKDDMR